MNKHYIALTALEAAVHRHLVNAVCPGGGPSGLPMDARAAGEELRTLVESLKDDLPLDARFVLPQHVKRVREKLGSVKGVQTKAEALRQLWHAVWDYLDEPEYAQYAR